ncbi:MAG: flagellar protein FliT, partial [Lachnospiraceae bacterium]|nr:flagellar protein FliT [Lachnospiraceae bacterium]
QKKNARQREFFLNEASTPEELDDICDEKGRLIDQIVALDDGFTVLYEKVKDAIDQDRAAYADEIRRMQQLIPEITDISNEILVEEQRNRTLASERFSSVKKQVQKVRTSQRAASTYYRNMMKRDYIDPQFLDHKE